MFRNNVLRRSLLLYEIYVNKIYVMRCAIWYHLYNFKNMKITHGGVLILVKACSFTKINTPPWVIFTFFKLYKWYQIAQGTTYIVIQKFDKGYYFVVIMLLLYAQ